MRFVESLNTSLGNLLEKNKNVIFYGEDLIDPYGGAFKASKGLSTRFPDRVLNTPISEATIVGMSAGMAISGLRPIVEIMFGDFLALSTDQIMNHLCKYRWMYNDKVTTPVLIRAAMGGRRGYGPTHSQSLEALLSSIPMLKIIAPSDYHDVGALLEKAVLDDDDVKIFSEHKLLYPRELKIKGKNLPEGLSYKETGTMYPTVSISNCEFKSSDVLIISFGGNAILIEEIMIDLLMEHELNVEAIYPSVIKPFPYKDITDQVKKAQNILIVEESPVTHGWGAEILAKLSENKLIEGKKIKRIGALEMPIPSSVHLEDDVLPSKKAITNQIKDMCHL